MKRAMILVPLLVTVLVVGSLQTGFAFTSASERDILGTVTLAEPVSVETLLDFLYSTEQTLTLEQLHHTHLGKEMSFVGGYFPPTGLSKAELLKDYRRFYGSMLEDLEKQSADNPELLAEIHARKTTFEKDGIKVYGLNVKGRDNEIAHFAKQIRAKDVKIAGENKYDVPLQPAFSRTVEAEPSVSTTEQPVITGAIDYCPSSGVVETYRDSEGWSVFYNTMTWTAMNKAQFAPNEGYEHDVVLYNYDGLCWADGLRGTLRGTGWDTNLPSGYLDYAKVMDKPEEPVYTIGTFSGTSLVPGTEYYGWLKAYPGNSQVDAAKLVGQKMDVYAFSVWSVFSKANIFIVGSWGIQVPSTHSWSH